MIYIDNLSLLKDEFGVFVVDSSKSSTDFSIGDVILLSVEQKKIMLEIIDVKPFHGNPRSDAWLLKVKLDMTQNVDYRKMQKTFRGYGEVIKK